VPRLGLIEFEDALGVACEKCGFGWLAKIEGVVNYEGWEWGKIAAGGSLVMAPVLVFSLAVRRYLVSGLTAGAVKG
jgi:ABC-type glycerol-3-phosphate transport system permease component